jgi:RNA polymerase sigma-70 factor (ECF subfamily)
MPAPFQFTENVSDSFSVGQIYYGDVDISLEVFSDYVWGIACKHLNGSADEPSVVNFTKKLYLRDLYLACGCVYHSEKAWTTFDVRYRKFLTDLVRFCYRHGTDNEEVADSVFVSLYFNDRSGRQRIASYDGRSSLATWLRVIVINRAINDRSERRLASDEGVGDIPDSRALTNLDATLRARRYGSILSESLSQALREITAKERLMLLWRYEQNLQLGEIAQLMGIHQSNVTRQLLRLQTRLRVSVVQRLASQHQMSASAIEECLAEVVDNPQISIPLMSLIKAVPKPAAKADGASYLGANCGIVKRSG